MEPTRKTRSLVATFGVLVLCTLYFFSCRTIKDPLKNFDYLWKTFDQRYAFFKLRGVDWQKTRAIYRKKLNKDSSQLTLYRTLKDMTDQLRDYHIDWDVPDSISRRYKGKFDSSPYNWSAFVKYGAQLMKRYTKKPRSYNGGGVRWGILKQANVGLIQVNEMSGLVDCDDLQSIAPGYFCAFWTMSTTAIQLVMKKILEDFKGTRAIILDVRFNTGGYDAVARALLRSLIAKPIVAYSKRERRKDTLLAPEVYSVAPAPTHQANRLFVLTSHMTASAAEVFVLSTMHLPYATRIGDRTRGILSDMYYDTLPNGWDFSLSHQIYYCAKGKIYERVGIPPHIKVPYPIDKSKAFLKKLQKDLPTGDIAVEHALRTLRQEASPKPHAKR